MTLWGSLALPQSLASWPCESIATSEPKSARLARLPGNEPKSSEGGIGQNTPGSHPKPMNWFLHLWLIYQLSERSRRDCLHILRTAGPIHAPVLLWLQVNDRNPWILIAWVALAGFTIWFIWLYTNYLFKNITIYCYSAAHCSSSFIEVALILVVQVST